MEFSDRFSAFIAYLPVIGWIYVLLQKRRDPLPMFHVRQSIGLFIFLAAFFAGWFAVIWLLSLIPFGFMLGIALFTIVIATFLFGIVAWVTGIFHALQGRRVLLPLFGKLANRLPL
jgi:uncharacterized membrane protein